MSDETRQHPRSRRRLLKLGLASPLLLPLHAAQASAPIRVGQPSRPGSASARASTPKAAASGTTAKARTTAASAAPTKARTAGGIQRTALETPARTTAASTGNRAIAAVRMWPSREYTRVTFELTQAIPFRARLIDNPNRVILDLEGLEVESKVRELLGKISTHDPFVRRCAWASSTPRPCASSST
ncbi:AMIN domain-containing protein [Lautropia mirabilis]